MPPEDNDNNLKTGNEIEEALNNYVVPVGSGLAGVLQDYLPKEEDNKNGDGVNYLDEIKDLPETDRMNLTSFFQKEEWKPEEILDMELGDASKEKLTQLFPEVFTKPPESSEELPGGDLGDMDKEALIVELKKHQTIAHDRELKLTDANKQIEVLESKKDTTGEESAVRKDLELLATDFSGNYDKVRAKYNLPSLGVIKQQLDKGGATARIKQWQENFLSKHIEKEFALEDGEFEYNSNDAANAGTASYMWDDLTSDKRGELQSEQNRLVTQENKQTLKVEEQQKNDIKWYADTYVDGDEKKTDDLIKAMNVTVAEISEGKVEATRHPFAMRNLLRGYYFDDLVQAQVEEAIAELTDQFAKHNMHLPSKELPTDVTRSRGAPQVAESFSKELMERSPMYASMFNTLSQKKPEQ